MTLHDRFEANDGEYLKFELVENKKSTRPDLHAFLMLEELFPTTADAYIVCHAQHDQIWLDYAGNELHKLTDDQIIELTRCGVLVDSEDDSLYMHV